MSNLGAVRYRKKPIVVEAIQWNGLNIQEIKNFVGDKLKCEITVSLTIETLEGEYIVSLGDYIIKGIKGELYPCKPDIFEMTYEKVESGVTPMEVHREDSVQNLQRAIREHLAYGLQIPLEWVKEYNCLLKESEEN